MRRPHASAEATTPLSGRQRRLRASDPGAPVEPSLARRSGSRLPIASSAKTASPARAHARAPREFLAEIAIRCPAAFAEDPAEPISGPSSAPPRAPCSAVGFADDAVLPRFARPRLPIPPSQRRALSPCGRGRGSATHRVDCRISPHVGDIHRVKVTTHTSLMNDGNFLI